MESLFQSSMCEVCMHLFCSNPPVVLESYITHLSEVSFWYLYTNCMHTVRQSSQYSLYGARQCTHCTTWLRSFTKIYKIPRNKGYRQCSWTHSLGCWNTCNRELRPTRSSSVYLSLLFEQNSFDVTSLKNMRSASPFLSGQKRDQ